SGAWNPYQANEVIVVWDGHTEFPGHDRPRQVPVRLRLGEKPARQIKELRGTLSAEVEAPAEPLVAVKDVVHAAGKLMKGPDGSYVKVLEAGREPGGQIKLKLEVKAPPRASDFSGVTNLRVLRINRRRAFIEPNVNLSATDALSRGLSLLDAR